MDQTLIFVDLVRAAHLLLFAAGMGTSLYCDFEKFRALQKPFTQADIDSLIRLHMWISSAFAGLWVTGIALIYIRTGFDIAAFSPKLWLKIGLMSLMLLNSFLIGRVVIPVLQANTGRPITSLRPEQFFVIGQIGIVSMLLWTCGLMLGASAFLKTAGWDVLIPLAVSWFLIMSVVGQLALHAMRRPRRDLSVAGQ